MALQEESGLYSWMNSEYEVINDAVAQDIPGYNNWDVRCGKCSMVLWTDESSGKALCPVLGITLLQIIFWCLLNHWWSGDHRLTNRAWHLNVSGHDRYRSKTVQLVVHRPGVLWLLSLYALRNIFKYVYQDKPCSVPHHRKRKEWSSQWLSAWSTLRSATAPEVFSS